MRLRLGLLLAAAACVPSQLWAQAVVISPAPEAVGVTIYRNPDRAPDSEMDLDWLEGYALVTEKRTVDIPAGRTVLRFEGVAAGMLPESAIVTGLPDSVSEKNLDADLLSPGSLYARSYGRPAIVRRQHTKTGKVIEERAIIRSGPEGSVIVQTRAGFEVANCGPHKEELVFDGVPEGLADKPTLSVETEASAPARVTVSLSYLSWGFDWQSNYVLRMNEKGDRADVLAWVTLASSDATSFPDAETSVVGGKVNREGNAPYGQHWGSALPFHCFFRPVAPPPAAIMHSEAYGDDAEIIVTAQKRVEMVQSAPIAVTVVEEQLGDLKLYRIPMPTTVAARAQKQVAMFDLPDVKLRQVFVTDIWGTSANDDVVRHLRLRNRKKDGLGRALPAGQVVLFEPYGEHPLLTGEGILQDSAVGEDLDIELGAATQVTATLEEVSQGEKDGEDWVDAALIVSNANAFPVTYEARIGASANERVEQIRGKIERKDGRSVWSVTVPANGSKQMEYRLRRLPEE